MAEKAILEQLDSAETIPDSGDFSSAKGFDHNDIVNIIKSLHGFRLVDAQEVKKEKWVLTDEGKVYAASGSPEVQLFDAVPPEGISREELQCEIANLFNCVLSISMAMLLIDSLRANYAVRYCGLVEVGNWLSCLWVVKKIDPSIYKIGTLYASKNRWLDMGKQQVSRKVQDVADQVKDLLLQIKDGKAINQEDINALKKRKLITLQTWNGYSLKKGPNFALERKKLVTDFTREHMQSFEEMPTNNYVESSYEYDWKREEANKNVLRTHTTAVSARMLYKLAQKPFIPRRYFSIDRVFRNEAVDRTHLAEFHQIEGIVCDRGLTLGDLMGVLHEFFTRLGMSNLRFKPTYNPYTEPSMEIFSYHEGLKKWVEVGNSGMFRPEMLLPMGLPEDVTAIAWGLSLERFEFVSPTMILYGIDNIRDLFGPKVDLSLIKRNPICRLGID
ncbi:hypothetical protein Syun_005052 [Stephania yunnanensis]|uniref:phenylalanine--tRNA ligase n=1 Tax=Stephania yunnanensis TaxID=152371 RepID=A0AAP0L522_9MAGN